MTPVTYRLEDLKNATIELGFVGENEHRMIRFDSTKLFDEYPDAVVALTVVAPSGEAYPAVTGRDGNFVSWVVTDSDLVKDGSGELQLTFIEGNAVAKTYRARTKVYGSIEATGEAPTPVEQWMIAANAALNGIPVTVQNALAEAKASGMFDGKDGVGIVSISKTSTSGKVDTYTVTLSDGSTYPITVTNGEDGAPGAPGYTPRKGVDYFDGQDGYTPVKGVDYFDGQDGQDGQDGAPGADGVSPTVTVTDITGGHRVVITDAEGAHTFDVMDGTTPVQNEWELIRTYTVAENVDTLDITTDDYGEPFALKRALIQATFAKPTTGTNDYLICFLLVKNESGNIEASNAPTNRFPSGSSGAYFEYSAENMSGIWIVQGRAASGRNSTSAVQQATGSVNKREMVGIRFNKYASSQTQVPAGSVIEIYGIRY